MSADYDAGASVAASPPKRQRRRYRKDVRSVADLDGRTRAARNATALINRLEAQLADRDPTAAQGELITRAALLSVLAGDCEIKIMRGLPVDIHGYVALVNCQRRVLQALGLSRDPKLINGEASNRGESTRSVADVLARYLDAPAEGAKP